MSGSLIQPGTPAPVVNRGLQTDIILVDFVGFSTLDDNNQYLAMSLVSRTVGMVLEKLARDTFGKALNMAVGWIPTGDGFYIILNEHAIGTGIFAALALRHILLTRINQTVGLKGVRFAIHHGPAIAFDDVTGRRNYIGSGLNDCARLLSLRPEIEGTARNFHRDENFVVASEQAIDYFFAVYPRHEIESFLDVGGWRQSARFMLLDKHGKQHHFHFIDHHRNNMIGIPRIIRPIAPGEL